DAAETAAVDLADPAPEVAAAGAAASLGSSGGAGGTPPPEMRYEPTRTMQTADQTGPGPVQDAGLDHTGDEMTRQDQQSAGQSGQQDQPPGGQNGQQDQLPVWQDGQGGEPGGRRSGWAARRAVLIGAAAGVAVIGAVVGVLLSSGSPGASHPLA